MLKLEPLRNCIQKDNYGNPVFYARDVKAAANLYKKYSSLSSWVTASERLKKDYPEMYKIWLKDPSIDYDKWLFNYCFGDVIE